jgi:hypothetical protein
MASVALVHPEKTFAVPFLKAVNKLTLFQNQFELLGSASPVKSPVASRFSTSFSQH